MSTAETFVKLIGVMDEVNDLASSIIVKPGARYLSIIYRRASEIYHNLKETLGSKPDYLPTLLKIEVGEKHSSSLITPLMERISRFTNWYHPQSEVIDDAFSFDTIDKVIDSEVDFKYGKDYKEAQEDFNTISEDERVWHELTKAYGSRSNCGTKPDSLLTKEDWDYIRGSLEEFKKHFNCTHVDLPTMYEEFETKIKPEWLRCYQHRNAVYDKMIQYRHELERIYEYDVFDKIDRSLSPLVDSLPIGQGNKEDCHINPSKEGSAPDTRLGLYESLRECIPSQVVFDAVTQLADEYFGTYNKIDGVFGYTLLQQLKQHMFTHKNGCSQAHFGELLLKQFGNRCSFKKGGAISDAKDSKNGFLEKQIQELFDGLKMSD